MSRCTANKERNIQNEAVSDTLRARSVLTIVGNKPEVVAVRNITLAQGHGEITLDGAYRLSSIELHQLEEFEAVICDS